MERTEASKKEGFKLMVARRQAGFTQKQLGAKVGCTGKWISEIEQGRAKASAQTAKKIEKALTEELSEERIKIFENF